MFSQYEHSENARGTCERGLYSTSAQHLAGQCQHRSVQERRHQRLRGRRRPPLRTVHALTARSLLGHCYAKLNHWVRSLFARGQGTEANYGRAKRQETNHEKAKPTRNQHAHHGKQTKTPKSAAHS